jgi:pyridoxamine 5'-phosphate oxidase
VVRTDYAEPMPELSLDERDLDPNPVRQFQRWLDEAWQSGEPMANAMAVASATRDGLPSVRTVLLTGVDDRGFAFETNLASPKATDFQANPRAALLFLWPKLLRQVRVTGLIAPIPRAEIEESFAKAPPEIQAMIRACRQGQVIATRAELEQRWRHAMESAPEGGAPMPSDWGGYRVSMGAIEFWQGRANRLQDRLRLTRQGGGWRLERLIP